VDTGGLAFLDCLGFKGIWRSHSPDGVLDRLENAERAAAELVKSVAPFLLRTQCIFISDTVVVGVTPAEPREMTLEVRGMLVGTAAVAAQMVTRHLINGAPPITTRGCVTYGDFILRGSHVIGPGVDEAATLHEKADGAFIWIRPDLAPALEAFGRIGFGRLSNSTPQQVLDNARKFNQRELLDSLPAGPEAVQLEMVDRFRRAAAWRGIRQDFLQYCVPMKGGGSLDCPVINPLGAARDIDFVLRQYEIAMTSQSFDVMMKRHNTFRFLRYAAEHTRSLQTERRKLFGV
jgi:hypothetical protein